MALDNCCPKRCDPCVFDIEHHTSVLEELRTIAWVSIATLVPVCFMLAIFLK